MPDVPNEPVQTLDTTDATVVDSYPVKPCTNDKPCCEDACVGCAPVVEPDQATWCDCPHHRYVAAIPDREMCVCGHCDWVRRGRPAAPVVKPERSSVRQARRAFMIKHRGAYEALVDEPEPCGHAPMQVCDECEEWTPEQRSRINGPVEPKTGLTYDEIAGSPNLFAPVVEPEPCMCNPKISLRVGRHFPGCPRYVEPVRSHDDARPMLGTREPTEKEREMVEKYGHMFVERDPSSFTFEPLRDHAPVAETMRSHDDAATITPSVEPERHPEREYQPGRSSDSRDSSRTGMDAGGVNRVVADTNTVISEPKLPTCDEFAGTGCNKPYRHPDVCDTTTNKAESLILIGRREEQARIVQIIEADIARACRLAHEATKHSLMWSTERARYQALSSLLAAIKGDNND